uniref:Kinesin-like protein n=1 Tax=Macrostomum lignano TaxID=282301 RepID=A0A1I8JN04_9PLAT
LTPQDSKRRFSATPTLSTNVDDAAYAVHNCADPPSDSYEGHRRWNNLSVVSPSSDLLTVASSRRFSSTPDVLADLRARRLLSGRGGMIVDRRGGSIRSLFPHLDSRPDDTQAHRAPAAAAVSSELSPSAAGVKVAVRIRPLVERELQTLASATAGSNSTVVSVSSDDPKTLLVHQPSTANILSFCFDHCLDSTNPKSETYADQNSVYEKVGLPLLDKCLAGYNCCLFAYGMTSSGKTHTVMGAPVGDDRGLLPRFCCRTCSQGKEIIEDQCEQLQSASHDKSLRKVSLKVREHPTKGPFVEGLSVYSNVRTYADVMTWLALGNKQRATASTDVNQLCISSRVNIVDLAGSERQSVAGTTGDRLREGSNINRSLLTLGKLRQHIDETLSTLRYATKARSIVNLVRVNEDKSACMIRTLQAELERLRQKQLASSSGSEQSEAAVALAQDNARQALEISDLRDQLQACKLQAEELENWKLARLQAEAVKENCPAASSDTGTAVVNPAAPSTPLRHRQLSIVDGGCTASANLRRLSSTAAAGLSAVSANVSLANSSIGSFSPMLAPISPAAALEECLVGLQGSRVLLETCFNSVLDTADVMLAHLHSVLAALISAAEDDNAEQQQQQDDSLIASVSRTATDPLRCIRVAAAVQGLLHAFPLLVLLEAAAASIAICCRQLAPLIYAGGSGGVSTFLSWLAARQCPTDAVGTRLLVRSELRVVALAAAAAATTSSEALPTWPKALDDFVGSVDCLLADAAGSAALVASREAEFDCACGDDADHAAAEERAARRGQPLTPTGSRAGQSGEQEGTPTAPRRRQRRRPQPERLSLPAFNQRINWINACPEFFKHSRAVVSHCQQTLRYLEILLGGSQLEIITVGVKCQHEMQRLDLDLDCLPVSKLFDSSIEPSRACLRRLKLTLEAACVKAAELVISGRNRHQRR